MAAACREFPDILPFPVDNQEALTMAGRYQATLKFGGIIMSKVGLISLKTRVHHLKGMGKVLVLGGPTVFGHLGRERALLERLSCYLPG